MELWTAFLLGLAGSLHCAGMCGPIAMLLPDSGRDRRTFLMGRVMYNLGRLITYGLLGLLLGTIGKGLFLAGVQRGVSIGLGLIILLSLLASRRINLSARIASSIHHLKAAMSLFLRRRGYWALMVTGGINGLLPCGLVYAAAAAATTTDGPWNGMWYMLVFGLGTVPMMLGIALTRRPIQLALRLRLQPWMTFGLAVLAVLLILRGLSLGIPLVSPVLCVEETVACH